MMVTMMITGMLDLIGDHIDEPFLTSLFALNCVINIHACIFLKAKTFSKTERKKLQIFLIGL